MAVYTHVSSPQVLFMADTHFRDRRLPREAERRRRFIRVVSEVPAGSAIFLLGDIFDFYIEYGSVISNRYFDIFHALYDCGQRGVDVHFVGGNHDFWVGDFLNSELGVTTHRDDIFVECQGRKIWCTHGDLIMPDDNGYRVLRSFIRNPLIVAGAKVLHPDILDGIAARFSKQSKKRNQRPPKDMAHYLLRKLGTNSFANGNDIFIMGHIHYPLHEVIDGRDFVILGDWIEYLSIGTLCDGKIELTEVRNPD